MKTSISFRGVDFSYGDDNPLVLKDVNLDIPTGKTIALVGPSGAGKSTIIDLIIGKRYYFTISYLLILLGAAIIIKDYNVFFDWLFEKSAQFLHSFSVIGWNYYVASVIICVFVPLAILIILLLIAI